MNAIKPILTFCVIALISGISKCTTQADAQTSDLTKGQTDVDDTSDNKYWAFVVVYFNEILNEDLSVLRLTPEQEGHLEAVELTNEQAKYLERWTDPRDGWLVQELANNLNHLEQSDEELLKPSEDQKNALKNLQLDGTQIKALRALVEDFQERLLARTIKLNDREEALTQILQENAIKKDGIMASIMDVMMNLNEEAKELAKLLDDPKKALKSLKLGHTEKEEFLVELKEVRDEVLALRQQFGGQEEA